MYTKHVHKISAIYSAQNLNIIKRYISSGDWIGKIEIGTNKVKGDVLNYIFTIFIKINLSY